MEQDKDTLTIATYNIELSTNVEKIVNNIVMMAKSGVVVFCLQEVVNSQEKELILDTIINKLGTDWKAASFLGDKNTRRNLGSAVIWNSKKLHFENEKKILLPNRKAFSLHEFVFGILVGGSTYPIQRRAITCTFTWNNKTITISSVHADHSGGPSHRIRQITYFMKNLPRTTHEIICGDFNTFDLLKTGKEKRMLQNTLGPEFVDASSNSGPTADLYNMQLHTRRIIKDIIKLFHIHFAKKLDYIWVKNFEVLSCDKQTMSGSDHYPLVAKLTLKK